MAGRAMGIKRESPCYVWPGLGLLWRTSALSNTSVASVLRRYRLSVLCQVASRSVLRNQNYGTRHVEEDLLWTSVDIRLLKPRRKTLSHVYACSAISGQ